jgi:hypothetical protein
MRALQELIESHRSTRELPTHLPYPAVETLIKRFQGRQAVCNSLHSTTSAGDLLDCMCNACGARGVSSPA